MRTYASLRNIDASITQKIALKKAHRAGRQSGAVLTKRVEIVSPKKQPTKSRLRRKQPKKVLGEPPTLQAIAERLAAATRDLYSLCGSGDVSPTVRHAVIVLDATVRALDSAGDKATESAYAKIATEAREFHNVHGVDVSAGVLGTAVLDESMEKRLIFGALVQRVARLQNRVRTNLDLDKAVHLLADAIVQTIGASKLAKRLSPRGPKFIVFDRNGKRTAMYDDSVAKLIPALERHFRADPLDDETAPSCEEVALACLRAALHSLGEPDVDSVIRGLENAVRQRARPNKK